MNFQNMAASYWYLIWNNKITQAMWNTGPFPCLFCNTLVQILFVQIYTWLMTHLWSLTRASLGFSVSLHKIKGIDYLEIATPSKPERKSLDIKCPVAQILMWEWIVQKGAKNPESTKMHQINFAFSQPWAPVPIYFNCLRKFTTQYKHRSLISLWELTNFMIVHIVITKISLRSAVS